MKNKCGMCGQNKEVFAFQEREWEEVKEWIPKCNLLIENKLKPLRGDDIVGIPICRECFGEAKK